MRKPYFLASFLFLSFVSEAQKNTVTTGGIASGSGGTVTYTVGQVDYANNSGTNGTCNEGVQQPYEFFLEAGINENSLLNIVLFPNPTNEFIILRLQDIHSKLFYQLYDSNGKLISKNSIKNSETVIDFRGFLPGAYHLIIKNDLSIVESIKIVKN